MIYSYIQKELKGYAISLTKNLHDAEDLIQDTCERMFRKYNNKDLAEQIRLSGSVMKNMFVDWCRQKKLVEELSDIAVKDELFDSIERKELQSVLLKMKSKTQSFSFRLKLEGYTNNEIGIITGKNNVHLSLTRAKKNIIKQLN